MEDRKASRYELLHLSLTEDSGQLTTMKTSPKNLLSLGWMALAVASTAAPASASDTAEGVWRNESFTILYGEEGITSLRRTGDRYDTDYIAAERALGRDVAVRYRRAGEEDWETLDQVASKAPAGESVVRYRHADSPDLEVVQAFDLHEDSLAWSITLTNRTAGELQIGDLAVPMVFAEKIPRDRGEIYTRKLLRHSYLAGHASWIFWQRANAEGPFLVMTTGDATKFEYFDESAEAFTPYIHGSVASRASIETAKAFGGTAEPWRLPLTSRTLRPVGEDGSSVTYDFTFQFAEGFEDIRQTLYDEDLFDVNIVPGMALPVDLPALISLRTKVDISEIRAEFPESTTIAYLGERGTDQHIYEVQFARLGENMLTVEYREDRWMSLEFFIMEPLKTVIKKRAKFLVETHQHSDPDKPWYGGYGDWDQVNQVLRSPEDRDGMRPWLVDSSDDAGNARPAYIAAKNVFYPDRAEIASVERYIRYYLWNDFKDGKGGMQMTEDEKYPYGIYGTFDNWWGHRASDDPGRDGRAHLWRIYDYPHIIHLYYRMHQIAKFYPSLVDWADAAGYLELAYRTAVAYWEVPMEIEGWSADSVGTMNEAFLPELIDALAAEGHSEWSAEIRNYWEGKVARFVLDTPNLYGSEFAFDSTGFESTQAFARYALRYAGTDADAKPADDSEGAPRFSDITPADAKRFDELQMRLNLWDRGWLETTYYQLGSDYRSDMTYLLSYMSHLGGWAVLDHGLYFSEDPAPLLRLGYASSLSAWATVNSGTPESGYGFWYPGSENDGAAGGGFIPNAWGRGWISKDMPRGAWYYSAEQDVGYVGALRTHRTILTDDPLFGEIALGGLLERAGDLAKVIPSDGLGVRFHIMRGSQRLHILLERDRFAEGEPITVSDSLDRIEFAVESRGGPEHIGSVFVSGLPAGSYRVWIDGEASALVEGREGRIELKLPVPAAGVSRVRLSIAP